MGKPLMIQEADNERIEKLKIKLHIEKKIDVIRLALKLLDAEAERVMRIKRWKQSAKLVSDSSHKVNKEMRAQSKKRLESL